MSDTFGKIYDRGIRTLSRSSGRHLSAFRDQQEKERSSSGRGRARTREDARENACVEEGIFSGEEIGVVNGSGHGVVDDEWLSECWATGSSGGGTGTGAGVGGCLGGFSSPSDVGSRLEMGVSGVDVGIGVGAGGEAEPSLG